MQSDLSYLIVSGGVLVVLLFLSAMVSGSEVAFFSLGPLDLDSCRKSNQPRDRTIVSLLKNPKKLLATILILNNTLNVAIVTLATFMTWRILGVATTGGQVLVGLTFAVTFFIVFFGEIIPKVYATQNALQFARRTAKLLAFTGVLFSPLSYFLMAVSRVIEKRFEKKGYDVSVQDLNEALEITTVDGTSDEEKEIIKGIVNFGTISVKQVMKSRLDITAIESDSDFHEVMDLVNKSGFSRIPVFEETIDNIKGILYIKDLLPYLENDESFNWQKLLRKGFFIPENKKIDTLLRDFQERRIHIAIVVDEYGGTSGMITLEDVIEEIVGEINDEFDDEDVEYRQLDDDTYLFEGKVSLNDFCKVLGIDPIVFEEVKGENESVGGLILELNKGLPNAGEVVNFDRFVFTTMAVDKKRIKKVKVFVNESANDGEVASASVG